MDNDTLRYPIGHFTWSGVIDREHLDAAIERFASAPAKVRALVEGLSEAQIDTSYREGGWTVRQVVHHLADAVTNVSVRIRLALTEDNPAIVLWEQPEWAKLPDAKNAPVEMSLQVFESLSARLVTLFRALSIDQFQRTYYHPQSKRNVTVAEVMEIYAWHGHHHAGHIALVAKG